MAYSHENKAAENHPRLREFIKSAGKLRGDLVMHLEDLVAAPLLPFAKDIIVATWDGAQDDFRFRYWGATHVDTYGTDLSGSYAADGGFADHHQLFCNVHLEVMEKQKPSYGVGILDWTDRSKRKWYQVILPLRAKDKVTDTLTFFHFE